MADPDAQNDGQRLTLLVHKLLFHASRPAWGNVSKTSPWFDIVKERVARLRAGGLEALYRDMVADLVDIDTPPSDLKDPATVARMVDRAVYLGKQGNLSRSLNSLA
jgi:hypothetical protein